MVAMGVKVLVMVLVEIGVKVDVLTGVLVEV